jgi:hypothetical protein
VFGFVMAYVWFKISDMITPIRDRGNRERRSGRAEVGVLAYPDFALHQGKGSTNELSKREAAGHR